MMFVANSTQNHDTTPSEQRYFPEEDQDLSITLAPRPLQRLHIAHVEWSKFFLRDTTNSTRNRDGTRTIHMSAENHRLNVAWWGEPLEEAR